MTTSYLHPRRLLAGLSLCLAFLLAVSGCATRAQSPETTVSEEAQVPLPEPFVATEALATTAEAEPGTAPAASAPERTDDAQPRSISLSEAIELALATNLDVALSQAQHEIAETRALASQHAFYPSVELGTGISRTDGIVQGSFGDFRDVDSTSYAIGGGLAFSKNIGVLVQESVAARHSTEAALQDAMAVEQRLILNVVELYQNLVLAKVALQVAEQLVQSSEEFEHVASVRYEGGIGLGSDAARAQANLAASRQQLEQAENFWRNTSVRLATVLRLEPKVLLDPVDTEIAAWQLPPDVGDGTYADDAMQRPDIASARERAEAAQRILRARWWDLVAPELTAEWRLNGVGGEGDTAGLDNGQALSNAAGSVGRSISAWQNVGNAVATPGANVFSALSGAAGSGGRAYYAYRGLLGSTHQDVGLESQMRYGVWLRWSLSLSKLDRLREQRLQTRVADLEVSRLEDQAISEVRQAQNDIRTAGMLITLAKDEIAAAETNHRLSLARFTAGTAIAFEVLDAQDSLAAARLKLARFTTEMNIAQARLLAAAGTIRVDSPAWAALD